MFMKGKKDAQANELVQMAEVDLFTGLPEVFPAFQDRVRFVNLPPYHTTTTLEPGIWHQDKPGTSPPPLLDWSYTNEAWIQIDDIDTDDALVDYSCYIPYRPEGHRGSEQSTMGIIMAVVAVLEIHMERKPVVNMNPRSSFR